jgi:hypothetical protein
VCGDNRLIYSEAFAVPLLTQERNVKRYRFYKGKIGSEVNLMKFEHGVFDLADT